MKILSMTATFGKLNNASLQLQPGLNVVCAPNEWGKSTWCAFLTNMFYGMETSARTTKTAMADKERYAPWSGQPMSGRIDLQWKQKNITIERREKGKIPFGEFSAYETESGIPVPELTASGCGQTLFGVERSVFQRSCFVQLSDLPVSQDAALLRRLNALVTTGDEHSAAEELEQKLKDLKNKCRSNRSNGLLPVAEGQRDAIQQKLSELTDLQSQCETIRARQQTLQTQRALLENHRQALAYEAAEADRQRVLRAEAACREAARVLQTAQENCRDLPTPESARQRLDAAKALQAQLIRVQAQAQPVAPTEPQAPVRYQYVAPEMAVEEAMKDVSRELALTGKKQRNSLIFGIYIGISVLLLAALGIPQVRALGWLVGAAIALGGVAVAAICILRTRKIRDEIEKLYDLHPGMPLHTWLPEAESYQKAYGLYLEQRRAYQNQQADLQARRADVEAQITAFAGESSLQAVLEQSDQALAAWDTLEHYRRDYQQALRYAEALAAVVKPAQTPASCDELTYTEPETLRLLSETAFELQQLHTRLGQCQGKMETLGSRELLQQQLDVVQDRIEKLQNAYSALELALQTLSEAGAQLQRRFAPRITRQAQEIFSRLTGGRYDRLMLSEDLSIHAGAREETTLRPARWRSEGTIDQLYLSLRLAVARELTPDAPLILDDAFARFDDTRLQAALRLLQEEAQTRQVILFTCQEREEALLRKA